MPKKILLIENDQAFAGDISTSLEASGFEVRVTGDGREGIDLAREWGPEAVVLSVELPGMSGYLVCQKLKKDEALKALPLVLTSAEATEETFEKHRTLKARADEYLFKPYTAEALIEKLGALVGLPEGHAAPDDAEEVVSLEEDLGLEVSTEVSAEGSPDAELGLDALDDEPVAGEGGAAAEDEDLRLFDDAFEDLSAASPAAGAIDDELRGEQALEMDDLDAAAASLPEEEEGTARTDLSALDGDTDEALGAFGVADEELEAPPPAPPSPARAVRAPSADLLRKAGIKLLQEEEPPPAPPPSGRGDDAEALERELADARAALAEREDEVSRLEARNQELSRRAEEASDELERVRIEADAAAAQVRDLEAEAQGAREQTGAAEAELEELRRKLEDAERRAEAAEGEAQRSRDESAAAADALARADAFEREAEELRTELLIARGEVEGAHDEIEKRTGEMRRRLSEAEASNAKNEERIVRAYQKIKADEKVREKVRKALAIAAQLLDEVGASSEPAERRTAERD